MRQYEMNVRIAQVHHLIEERKYKKALAVVETLDIRQIRGLSDLNAIAEVYSRTGHFAEALDTFTKIYRTSKTKRVLQRMIFLAIRTGDLEDAEEYYQEFADMHPNNRDLLTLRYRIDKAGGVPIGQLIEVLEALKEEEYVEEWAYELAKLYHAAGRYEDCRNECDDIITWFGYGEIVEHAKRLIEYVEDKDTMPFMDDKDFTVQREEPNPEDTGSLPPLDEFIEEEKQRKKQVKQRAEQIRQEVKERKRAARHGGTEDDIPEIDDMSFDDGFMDDFRVELPEDDDFKQAEKEPWENTENEQREQQRHERKEKHGRFGKDITHNHEPVKTRSEEQAGNKIEEIPQIIYTQPSQSGLGITQDLAKEISAIVAAENGEQLEEREVSVVADFVEAEDEPKDLASNIVARMTKAAKATEMRKQAPPAGIEEIRARGIGKEAVSEKQSNEKAEQSVAKEVAGTAVEGTAVEEEPQEAQEEEAPEPAAEEEAQEAQEEEAPARAVEEEPQEPVAEEEAKEVQGEELPEQAVGEEAQEAQEEAPARAVEEEPQEAQEEEAPEPAAEEEAQEAQGEELPEQAVGEEAQEAQGEELPARAVEEEPQEAQEEEAPEPAAEEEAQEAQEAQGEELPEQAVGEEAKEAQEEELPARAVEEEPQEAQEEETPEQAVGKEAQEAQEEEAPEPTVGEEAKEAQEEEPEPVVGEVQEEKPKPPAEIDWASLRPEDMFMSSVEILAEDEKKRQKEIERREAENKDKSGEEEKDGDGDSKDKKGLKKVYEDLPETYLDVPGLSVDDGEKDAKKEKELEFTKAVLEHRKGQVKIVAEDENKVLADEDLPTTRALHHSFNDVLTLIGGELDASHFVLMGDGIERIVGISKKIIKVVKESGFLSHGRIARINAKQLNTMDLISFKDQLKGNCLLVDEASELLFPTITRIFSVMDEFANDFVVILADEGKTLDQLFRFAPALAKRFKYIIDISQYTEDDYREE